VIDFFLVVSAGGSSAPIVQPDVPTRISAPQLDIVQAILSPVLARDESSGSVSQKPIIAQRVFRVAKILYLKLPVRTSNGSA
jgi:hypothetical protein